VEDTDKKTVVWICEGCEIGESLDVDALTAVVADDGDAESCQSHACLCGDEGVELLRKEVQEGANALVVAACSPRFNTDTFTFDGCLTERVNLREHVVWSHPANDEDTQMLAEDYLRMGLARASRTQIADPYETEVDKTILVVGGGQSGMTSALAAAEAGYDVALVEKEAQLGGWLREFSRLFPKKPPYRDAEPVDLQARVAQIEQHERITVHQGATIEQITGQPGQFDVSLQTNGTATQLRAGAIVQATGWKPYDASRLGHLGYGSPNVITNVQMEQLAAAGEINRPSDGKPAQRIAFIQCAGSRDENHLPYCSAVCCRVSLKQALWVRELNDEAQAYVLYKDIRAPGQYEDYYRRAQEDPGIFFTKGDVVGVKEADAGDLVVDMEDTLLGEHIQVEADLVVLATGMVPAAADGEAIRQLRDAQATVEKDEAGAQLEAAKVTVEELQEDHEGTEILQLGYRQGPDLPMLKYGFPDSHFICFPYETRRTGIYAAGCVRAPNDCDASREDAEGAVLKAIQCVELASQGKAVHPRWGDQSYPDFSLQRCTQCKRCTEECPFGTLDEDEKATPLPNITRCRRCGICLGACPERIVSFQDYSIDIVSSMIKAVEIPDEFEEKPRLLGLLCENDAYPALDTAGLNRIQHSAYIRFIPVRCLGSVNVVWITDALSCGYDGILLIGCKSGDDYQCHFIRGSELMGTRGDNIQEKLKALALEEERVRVEQLDISEFRRLPEIINEFADEIEDIGMNPFKGF